MGDDISELQREWRQIVLAKLDSLELGQNQLKTEVSGMKSTLAEQQARETVRSSQTATYLAELKILEGKIDDLESFKSKAVGVILTIQFAMGIVLYFLHASRGTLPTH